ncbi:bifunctional pyr operon transcriptional regulator/uracil phosphoribosyltransferase PyrR [Vampirovibrio chlorellavorus]|uniref:bifunctional pyr operon transcriptional regulator/uracil phosphoribosyltransferase PyrR n=1 Tax=Vampirovibrio chlorellavorus TaxID=758823 RepID=UPI0026EE33F7|nr:bifunctional pyr operon transcriptional regulator/uracil phosphoribosyltransferase PyrR [Vampirovibrio chlorellavorus]
MPTEQHNEVVIFNASDIERSLKRLAHELIERNQGIENVVLLGIVTRGKPLAERIAQLLQALEGKTVPVGYLDVTLYRDDTAQTFKPASESLVPVELTGKTVVLVDDVLYSGRSVRAALDALNGYGRPAGVQLLVLLDRGHRELPIRADYVGKNIPTAKQERVNVQLQEVDGLDQVILRK